jgi:hypothetical protein
VIYVIRVPMVVFDPRARGDLRDPRDRRPVLVLIRVIRVPVVIYVIRVLS